MHSKKWSICLLCLTFGLLIFAAALTGVIDPYFHYHKPLDALGYPINSERYQNYGIAANFSYDTLIIGSSMTQNFLASECDDLFDAKSVKLPLSGGTFSEFSQLIQHAIDNNPSLDTVFLGLDCWLLFEPADKMRTGEEFPTYLYDSDLFNDTQYLLNKYILLNDTLAVLEHTRQGLPTTSFDDYTYWNHQATFSREYVLSQYVRPEKSSSAVASFFLVNARETVEQNLLPLVQNNPDIRFYFFFTPCSILTMDQQDRSGLIPTLFESCAIASDLLLKHDNVLLFSFLDDYETITDLDNYFDTIHYSADINALMLQRMSAGEYRLTADTSGTYWQQVCAYYENYDYDALFQP